MTKSQPLHRILALVLCIILMYSLLPVAAAEEAGSFEVDGRTYAVLSAAIGAVDDGGIIKLLDNIAYDGEGLYDSKTYTIDLNEHTLSRSNQPGSGLLQFQGGNVTIINGSIENEYGNALEIMGGNVTIQNCEVKTSDLYASGAIYVTGGTVIIEDCEVSGDGFSHAAIYVNGGTVTVENSTAENPNGSGVIIYGGTVNILSGSYSGGNHGVLCVGAEQATITSGYFESVWGLYCLQDNIQLAPGSAADVENWLNGSSAVTVRVVPDIDNAFLSALSYSVGGGSAIETPGFAPTRFNYNVALPAGTDLAATITMDATTMISGANVTINDGITLINGRGTATVEVTAQNGTDTNTYTVNFKVTTYNFATGGVEYETLEDAVTAVDDGGGIITMLHNVELRDTVILQEDKEYTLDLGGYTLSADMEWGWEDLLFIADGTVTIENGTIDNSGSDGAAIDVFNNGTVIINGGNYIGGNSVYCQGGTLNIIDGNFTGNNRAVYCNGGSVTITAGHFESTGGVACLFAWPPGQIGLAADSTADVDPWLYDDNIGDGPTEVTVTAGAPADALPPTITVQPQNIHVYAGDTATLALTARASGNLTYQWYNASDDSPISSATSATYNAPTNAAGIKSYYCIVTNTDTNAANIQTATTTSNTVSVTVTAITDTVDITGLTAGEIQTAVELALTRFSPVYVTGAQAGVTEELDLAIPMNTKVIWQAAYRGAIASYLISPSGSGGFEVTSNGAVENTEDYGTAIYTYGDVTISGTGAVAASGDYGYAINANNVTVSGGTVAASGEGGYAINAWGSVAVSGTGAVEASGDFSYAINAWGSVAVSGTGAVEASGGHSTAISADGDITVESGAVAASGDYSFAIFAREDVTISGTGMVEAAGEGGTAINAWGVVAVSGTGAVAASGDYGTAILADGGVTVSDTGVVEATGNYGTAIYTSNGSVTVESGTVQAISCAIYTQGASSVITIKGGTIRASNGVAISAYYGNILVQGGAVEAAGDGTVAIASELGDVKVEGGMVKYTGDWGKAIFAGGDVKVSGGAVYKFGYSGYAISAAGGSSAVTVEGGVVFAQGADVIFADLGFSAPSNDGVVIAWEQTVQSYAAGTSADLSWLPTSAAVKWALNNGQPGISYTKSGNTGFIPVGSITVTVAVPDSPDNFTATPGNRQVTLSWITPYNGGSAILKYQYSASSSGTASWQDISGSGESTISYIVTGLSNGTLYTFKIRAVNSEGEGDEAVALATPATLPTAPRQLTATPGDTEVTLSWVPPQTDGGSVIIKYQYSASSNGTDSWQDIPVPLNDPITYTITGLNNGTLYTIKLRVVTGVGESPAATTTATPLALPYTATLNVEKDGAAWSNSGKTFTLRLSTNESVLYDISSGTVSVPNGIWKVYDGAFDTGLTIIINNAANSATLAYYTVTYMVIDAGSASGSTISTTYDSSAITSGDAVLGGKMLVITAVGAGASSYTYAWSGTASGATDTYTITVNDAVNAVCTVAGIQPQNAPAAPTLASKTTNSITLNTIPNNANQAVTEYSKDGGTTWQDSPAFTGLPSNTTYTFVARYKAVNGFLLSPNSGGVSITTNSGGGSGGGGGGGGGGGAGSGSVTPAPTPSTPPLVVGGNTVITPPNQPPITDADGNTTLPGGGIITMGNGTTINFPPGTTITGGGRVTVGKGGGSVSFGGLTLAISEGTTLAFDIATPLGYFVGFNNPFIDVKENDWFYNYVIFAYTHGLMSGISTEPMMFSPGAPMTRAMFVTVLARLDSVDVSGGETWYAKAAAWAKKNGIFDGTNLEAPITREQMAVMLYNYLKYKGYAIPESSAAAFADEADISPWALEAVRAMKAMGIIGGRPGNLYDPPATSTRAEVATLFARLVEAIVK